MSNACSTDLKEAYSWRPGAKCDRARLLAPQEGRDTAGCLRRARRAETCHSKVRRLFSRKGAYGDAEVAEILGQVAGCYVIVIAGAANVVQLLARLLDHERAGVA
jgi:hypothetical protein